MGCTKTVYQAETYNGVCRVHQGGLWGADFQCHDNVSELQCISLDFIKFTCDGYWPSSDCDDGTPYSSDDIVSQFYFPDSTCAELCENIELPNGGDYTCTIMELNN